ncbi:hypothetical protein ACWF82_05605 [Nocardia sp. NPDC055053]
MSHNPFDDDSSEFYILRQACLDYVETVWTDMRPASLVERMR